MTAGDLMMENQQRLCYVLVFYVSCEVETTYIPIHVLRVSTVDEAWVIC